MEGQYRQFIKWWNWRDTIDSGEKYQGVSLSVADKILDRHILQLTRRLHGLVQAGPKAESRLASLKDDFDSTEFNAMFGSEEENEGSGEELDIF